MPADPREFLILQNLQAALQAITVAGGYHFDVDPAAVKLDPDHDVEAITRPDGLRPFIYIEPKPETWTVAGMQGGVLKLDWPVTIHWVSDSTPTDDASRARTFFQGCADVERAIAMDRTRGGKAIQHLVTTRTFNVSTDGAQVWAEIDTMILVQRKYGDPNG